MITRDQALSLIKEHVDNKNIIKHMLATEALMGAVYDELGIKNNELWEEQKHGKKEEWMLAGLLHDGDYCEGVPMEKQGIQIVEWAKKKSPPAGRQGFEIPDNVAHAMAAHNFRNTKVEPKSLMDWAIVCGDTLTGLIVACALVRPDKKLSGLTVESVLKKFPSKSFAAGTRRDDIALCEEKLGLSLKKFIEISLKAMQSINQELGL